VDSNGNVSTNIIGGFDETYRGKRRRLGRGARTRARRPRTELPRERRRLSTAGFVDIPPKRPRTKCERLVDRGELTPGRSRLQNQ